MPCSLRALLRVLRVLRVAVEAAVAAQREQRGERDERGGGERDKASERAEAHCFAQRSGEQRPTNGANRGGAALRARHHRARELVAVAMALQRRGGARERGADPLDGRARRANAVQSEREAYQKKIADGRSLASHCSSGRLLRTSPTGQLAGKEKQVQ